MKPAELRRSYDELVDAYRALEQENQRLRAAMERPRTAAKPPTPTEKPVAPGNIVDYIDPCGHSHKALVLGVEDDGALRLKVFRAAVPDKLVMAYRGDGPNCWRRRR